jgi:FimV-like protein
MKRWSLLGEILAGLAAFLAGTEAGAASAATPGPITADQSLARRPWVELRSEGFATYTTGPTQEVARLLTRLEQFRFCYGQLAGAQSLAAPTIQVYVFENEGEFTGFKPWYQGRPSNVAGYFLRRPDTLVIALMLRGDTTNTLRVVFHEYTHFLLRNNHFWPVWIREGMADLYSTLELDGPKVILGQPPEHHLRTLHKMPPMPLSRLFAVTHTSADYNEHDMQGLVYAQSWLLAHYLATTEDAGRRKKFGDYTRLLRAGRGPEDAFVRALQTPLPAMEKELKDYLARGEFRPVTMTARTKPSVRLSQRDIPPAEASFLLGNLLLHLQREEEARGFFDQSKRLQPNSPFAHQGLGLMAVYQDREDEAIRELEQARRLGSRHHLTHYWLGWSKLKRLRSADGSYRKVPPAKGAMVNDIRASLREATRLMPSFGPAHYALGFVELVQQENLPSAEISLGAAYRLMPDDSRYGLALARAYLAQRKGEPARQLLEDLSKTANTEARAEAVRMLEQLGSGAGR